MRYLEECAIQAGIETNFIYLEDIGQDGEPTGVKRPYVVTIVEKSGEILSIKRNFNEGDPFRRKIPYFIWSFYYCFTSIYIINPFSVQFSNKFLLAINKNI